MIKKLYIILILILFNFFLIKVKAHPIHITIVNFNILYDERKIEINIKIFSDDLELAIYKETGINIGLTNNNKISNANELIFNYITKKIKIQLNKEKRNYLNYSKKLRIEHDEQTTKIDIEFHYKTNLKSLTIYNDLLNEIYDDMKNLVIINWKKEEVGIIFDKDNKIKEFK